MSQSSQTSPGGSDPGLGFAAFVTLIASIMAMNSLGIDGMLPALPYMIKSLHVAQANRQQWVMFAYMIGFGAAQIVWGPLADRYGRKPIVVASLACFGLCSFLITTVPTFELLLAARLLQGIAASASRVLTVSIIRDCYSGRRMARVMSLTFIVFLCVPLCAPGFGTLVLSAGGTWRTIFVFLGVYGLVTSAIVGLKLKETLHPEYRRPLSFGGVGRAMARVVTTRNTIGYTLAVSFMFGAMMGFINSIQQVIADAFHSPHMLAPAFAVIAGAMAPAALLNQGLVERLGMRRISHTALLAYIVFAACHSLIALSGRETLISFMTLMGCALFCQALVGSNFNAMAMESVGDIAGTAASVQGFISTCLAACIGLAIGQSYNGTTAPLAIGFVSVGLIALMLVLFVERGRLFRPHHPAPIR